MIVASTVATSAATPDPAQQRFTADDVFRLKSLGEVRISPDGHAIAYETSDADIMTDSRHRSIRLLDLASGQDRLLADGARTPRWAPDSKALVYAERRDGSDRLMLAKLDGTAPRILATMSGTPSAVALSKDGQLLAFTRFVPETRPAPDPVLRRPAGAEWAPPPRVVTTARHDVDGQGAVEPGHTQLFVLAMSGGAPRKVTSGPLDVVGEPAWSPDGRSLIYSAVNLETFGKGFRAGRLYRVPAVGGEPAPLTGQDLSVQSPAISPDGRYVAFIGWGVDGRDFSPIRLRLLDLRTGKTKVVEEALDRDFSSASWSTDGRWLFAGYSDRSVDRVRRIGIGDGGSADVAVDLGGDFTVGADGSLAYPIARSDRPADVALLAPGSSRPRLLTHRNDALLASKLLGETVPLAVTSSLDGAAVGAWLTRPAGYVEGRRYPLILDIHGGPYGFDGPVWRTADQLYAAAGYAVLRVNYRGSTSYGFAFADRIASDPLAPSYADLMSAMDAAVAAGVGDPGRLFVTGGSAGGELTAWIVGHTARFRAAMAEKPIINQVARTLSSDQYYVVALVKGPPPWEDASRLWSLSPLAFVGKVSTPTMLVVGEEDVRTPPVEALQFYHALKLRGVETELVLVPGASHESLGARPSQLASIVQLTLDWFERRTSSASTGGERGRATSEVRGSIPTPGSNP